MPRSWARSGRPAGTSSAPGGGVLVGAHHSLARRGGAHDLDQPGIGRLGVLDHHHRVGARRQRARPSAIATAVPGRTATSGGSPIATAPATSR